MERQSIRCPFAVNKCAAIREWKFHQRQIRNAPCCSRAIIWRLLTPFGGGARENLYTACHACRFETAELLALETVTQGFVLELKNSFSQLCLSRPYLGLLVSARVL